MVVGGRKVVEVVVAAGPASAVADLEEKTIVVVVYVVASYVAVVVVDEPCVDADVVNEYEVVFLGETCAVAGRLDAAGSAEEVASVVAYAACEAVVGDGNAAADS
jgi:hypothetical protein